MITGATKNMVMFIIKYDQSVAKVLAGIAIKVIALKAVPKILSPAAHQGTRFPPLK